MPARPISAVIVMETTTPGKKMKSGKKEKKIPEQPVYEPNLPEPTCRAELLKHWMNLTLDDKTANNLLWISDGGSKLCRRTQEVCPVLERPERYEQCPQVVCKEVIWNMRAYWEVEYTGWMVIGATFEGTGRKVSAGPSGLGDNEDSWGLCWAGTRYQLWFNGLPKDILDFPYSSTLGVYIDQPAGIMNFYIITEGGEGAEREAILLQKVKIPTDKKILPGVWVGIQSTCTMLKKPE